MMLAFGVILPSRILSVFLFEEQLTAVVAAAAVTTGRLIPLHIAIVIRLPNHIFIVGIVISHFDVIC